MRTAVIVVAALAAVAQAGFFNDLRKAILPEAAHAATTPHRNVAVNVATAPRTMCGASGNANLAVLFKSAGSCGDFTAAAPPDTPPSTVGRDHPIIRKTWSNCTVGSYCASFNVNFTADLSGRDVAGIVGWNLQKAEFTFPSAAACATVANMTFPQGSYLKGGCSGNLLTWATGYGFEFTMLLDTQTVGKTFFVLN